MNGFVDCFDEDVKCIATREQKQLEHLNQLDKPLLDYSTVALKDLFPLQNGGIINTNNYYKNNIVPRYLCIQVQEAIEAYKTRFCGGVYFLRDRERNLMKIGCSSNISLRIKQLNIQAKTFALDGDLCLIGYHPTIPSRIKWLEKWYHNLFKEYRYKYEWYRITYNDFVNTIESIAEERLIYIKNDFHDYFFIYSMLDVAYEEVAPAIDLWVFSPDTVQEMLEYEYLIKNKLTVLVQDTKGNIIPFGWRQEDLNFINNQNIWKSKNITCFQKERLLSLGSQRTQDNFTYNMYF